MKTIDKILGLAYFGVFFPLFLFFLVNTIRSGDINSYIYIQFLDVNIPNFVLLLFSFAISVTSLYIFYSRVRDPYKSTVKPGLIVALFILLPLVISVFMWPILTLSQLH